MLPDYRIIAIIAGLFRHELPSHHWPSITPEVTLLDVS